MKLNKEMWQDSLKQVKYEEISTNLILRLSKEAFALSECFKRTTNRI